MLDFYRGKRVFITGHTGFKGSWLCVLLTLAGAEVTGFALPPPGEENLFSLSGVGERVRSVFGDVRDLAALKAAFDGARPEIVFHLAAQPIVRESYRDPVGTYSTNVMGTVHILECLRQSASVRSFLNVTTDKVYQNEQWPWGYRESDRLNGFDPYSNSKSCSELVTAGYRSSFFSGGPTAVSTARAGNVIGGGDFAADRIVPDCVRAARAGRPIQVRNPASVRPYQHVLDPLAAYLLIARRQYEDGALAGSYNVGPESGDCVTTGALADLFCRAWGEGARWEHTGDSGPHEAAVLRLDCSKLQSVLGWRPRWRVDRAVEETVAWTKAWLSGRSVPAFMEEQIREFFSEEKGCGLI
nr:CDP-glucose 4,6-dehydratase [uncultured Oscillibacter sp.]